MTENNKNRFTDNETDCLIDSSFTDNLTKKIYVIDEWERIIGLCNNLWEQTQRFEKENQRLNTEIEQLKSEIEKLSYANEDLLSEKRNWQRMSDEYCKLSEENEQLKLDKQHSHQAMSRQEVRHKQFKDTVFDLIDEKIKLYSHKPISAPISQPMSVNFDADMDRLARLSELEALKEELQE